MSVRIKCAIAAGAVLATTVLSACASAPPEPTGDPVESVFAVHCGMAALLQRSNVRPDSDFYDVMTEQIRYWDRRHMDLEPNYRVRDQQRETAAAALLTRLVQLGAGKSNVMQLGVVLGDCRERREQLDSATLETG